MESEVYALDTSFMSIMTNIMSEVINESHSKLFERQALWPSTERCLCMKLYALVTLDRSPILVSTC